MTPRDKALRIAGRLLTAAFFLSIFFFFLTPISLGDFWWHLNTGKWIVQHGGFPVHDPFTFTTPDALNLRQLLILRGYWLAQVVLYLSYTAVGFAGPIVLKAAIFTIIYIVLWKNLTMRGLDGYAALLLVAPIPFFTTIFDEPRPQVFSFLGSILMFYLLEKTRERLRKGLRPGLALWSMPVFMLIWANVHRGYILGFMLLVVYMVDETVRLRRSRDALPVKDYRLFMGIGALSLAACLINPDFTAAFAGDFIDLGSPFMKNIDEFQPLRTFVGFKGLPWMLYGTLAMLTLSALVIFIARRRLRWRHLFLFSGFAFAGLLSGRFSIFMILMSLSIAAQYVPDRVTRFLPRLRPLFAAALIAVVVFISVSAYGRSFLKRGAVSTYYTPIGAADFILSARPPGPLFNAFEYGGYLGWRLYPQYRLFVDQRNLSYPPFKEFIASKGGSYADVESILEKHRINTLVLYMITPENPFIPRVVFHALRQKQWQLLYFDGHSSVFVRSRANPGIPVKDKQALWRQLEDNAKSWRDENPTDPAPLVMLGTIYEARDNADEALREYRAALRLDPGNNDATAKMKELLDRQESKTAS